MPVKPCLTCGALSPNSRCALHGGGGSWNGTRNTYAQRLFRRAVLERAGYQCQAVTDGCRCPVTNVSDIQAHHTLPGDNRPETGRALCRMHHREVDSHAR